MVNILNKDRKMKEKDQKIKLHCSTTIHNVARHNGMVSPSRKCSNHISK